MLTFIYSLKISINKINNFPRLSNYYFMIYIMMCDLKTWSVTNIPLFSILRSFDTMANILKHLMAVHFLKHFLVCYFKILMYTRGQATYPTQFDK